MLALDMATSSWTREYTRATKQYKHIRDLAFLYHVPKPNTRPSRVRVLLIPLVDLDSFLEILHLLKEQHCRLRTITVDNDADTAQGLSLP